MSTQTTNLGLIKPELSDVANITDMNQNWDTLDQVVNNKMNKHLLQYDGDIKENGVRLTFPVLYNILLSSPDFVVLVNDGEALHPNVVNNEEIVFVSVDPSEDGLTGRKVTMKNDGFSTVTLEDTDSVPSSRKINNKSLESDVTLTATDVGALPITGGTSSGIIKIHNSGSSYVFLGNTDSACIVGANRGQIQLEARNTDGTTSGQANNRRLLTLYPASYNDTVGNLKTSLVIADIVDGVYKGYNIYGDHNKDSMPFAHVSGTQSLTFSVNNDGILEITY